MTYAYTAYSASGSNEKEDFPQLSTEKLRSDRVMEQSVNFFMYALRGAPGTIERHCRELPRSCAREEGLILSPAVVSAEDHGARESRSRQAPEKLPRKKARCRSNGASRSSGHGNSSTSPAVSEADFTTLANALAAPTIVRFEDSAQGCKSDPVEVGVDEDILCKNKRSRDSIQTARELNEAFKNIVTHRKEMRQA